MGLPAAYEGLWRRERYAEPAAGEPQFVDRDTQVYWLQVGPWHADLRIAANRPGYHGVAGFDGCTDEQLVALAGQTAFAGYTVVEGNWCSWHRLVDLSPGLDKDIGRMEFVESDTLIERHPAGTYIERWQRLATAGETRADCDAHGRPRWLAMGDHAMAITPRSALAAGHDLLAEPARLDRDALLARLSLVLDFCRYRDGEWRVALSTLPWRQGRALARAGL